ncbi:hypothetical protein B0A48_10127 [Cryoendolithus antarcticus]|uniref:Uncharacterized protein n=1 Tax=Cryoendolithus antarcticus TaxID=1507870 RepID=A0A1V8SWD4_9PEZI|nr:hypothetical protein B0A48_10127 [Cryoendolithus antarcticus]
MSEYDSVSVVTALVQRQQPADVAHPTHSLLHQPLLPLSSDHAAQGLGGCRQAKARRRSLQTQKWPAREDSATLISTTGSSVTRGRRVHFEDDESVVELPRQIDVTRIQDMQMLGRFLQIYLPSARDGSIDHLTYTHYLSDLVDSTPLLKISCHALCFAFLGTIYNDERLKLRALRSYAWAIWFMRTCVFPDTTSKSLQKDAILSSLILLAHCEVHECIAVPGQISSGDAFLAHLNGAQAFFEINRDEILQSAFGRALCASLRSNAYLVGLIQRKPVRYNFGAAASISTRPQDQAWLELNTVSLEIPGFLRFRDQLLDKSAHIPSSAQLKRLVRRLIDARDRLINVFAKHYGAERGIRTGHIAEATTFARLWDDRSTAFDRIYIFESYQPWTHYVGYWSTLWEMDVMLLEISDVTVESLFPDLTLTEVLRHDALLKEAHLCATNVCRAFPASCEPDHIVFSPLRSLGGNRMRDFFKKYSYLEELRWVDDLSSIVASASTSWDLQCKFGHLSEPPVARISGSLEAWERG